MAIGLGPDLIPGKWTKSGGSLKGRKIHSRAGTLIEVRPHDRALQDILTSTCDSLFETERRLVRFVRQIEAGGHSLDEAELERIVFDFKLSQPSAGRRVAQSEKLPVRFFLNE
jgi:hypothetical protein